jgi:hypothetical protein
VINRRPCQSADPSHQADAAAPQRLRLQSDRRLCSFRTGANSRCASVRRVPAQIESFREAMPRDSSLGIPFNKFFSTCGKYDSVIYGRALSAPIGVGTPRRLTGTSRRSCCAGCISRFQSKGNC